MFYLFECYCMSGMAIKYIRICTSNTCKGKVSGCVYESLRRETFSFCQGRMNVFACTVVRRGRRRIVWRCSDHSFPCRSGKKQLVGQLTSAFPGAFFFFFLLIQRLTEPILANFGLKQFQPKRRKADTCSSYTSMDIL